MDAKRHKEPEEIAQKALEAKALIEAWRPDVVITADDDAAQYLIMPFYKDHTTLLSGETGCVYAAKGMS
jgi:hypothetical protein